MAFLLGTFIALRQLLDMGSSAAFYTFMSQRPRPRHFVRSFYAWLGIQFSIPIVVVGLLLPTQWLETIWHGEHRSLIVLAFVAVFMQYSVWPAVQQAGESQRKTIWVQGIGAIVVGVHLAAITLLWLLGSLGLYAIFTAIAIEYLVAAAVANKLLAYPEPLVASEADGSSAPTLRQYLQYCLPLVPYACVGFMYEFADRWLLQHYGGSVQQAYYAVGAQFSSIALVATASILNIFWKEIAEAHHNGEHARTQELYRMVSRMLFLVGAVIAGFLCPWAEELLRLILGDQYVGGAVTLMIMFLYPVHQSMGQIGGTMLYATERVSIWARAGIVFMLISIGVTYWVLASPEAPVPGLGLASTGLALKMVLLQLVQVNIVAYVIARQWGWRFDWLYQPVSLFGCLGLGWVAHSFATALAGHTWSLPAVMAVGGVFYLAFVAGFVYALPVLAGLTRERLVLETGLLLRQAIRVK
jgi:hypothetical protein